MRVPPDTWVEAKTNEGWGIAAGVVGLAVLCIVMATVVHQRTYRHPTDVTWHATGQQSTPEIRDARPAH